MRNKWLVVKWSMLLIIVIVVFFFTGLSDIVNGYASLHWPIASGIITESFVVLSHTTNDSNNKPAYGADITYIFNVNGKSYNGHRVIYGEFSSSDQFYANEKVKRFPKGKQIKVYYKPNDPKQCVLITGVNPMAYITLCIAFAIVGLVAAVLKLQRRQSQRDMIEIEKWRNREDNSTKIM